LLNARWRRFVAGHRGREAVDTRSKSDTLEDLGGGLGVTDPVSGEVAVELRH
jgi:hypothetical protein